LGLQAPITTGDTQLETTRQAPATDSRCHGSIASKMLADN